MKDKLFGVFFKRISFYIIGVVCVAQCVLAAEAPEEPGLCYEKWARGEDGKKLFPVRIQSHKGTASEDHWRIKFFITENKVQEFSWASEEHSTQGPAHGSVGRARSQAPQFYAAHETQTSRHESVGRPRPQASQMQALRECFYAFHENPIPREESACNNRPRVPLQSQQQSRQRPSRQRREGSYSSSRGCVPQMPVQASPPSQGARSSSNEPQASDKDMIECLNSDGWRLHRLYDFYASLPEYSER